MTVDHPTKPFVTKLGMTVSSGKGSMASYEEVGLDDFLQIEGRRVARITPEVGTTVTLHLLQGPLDHHGDGVKVSNPSILIIQPDHLGLEEFELVVDALQDTTPQSDRLPELFPAAKRRENAKMMAEMHRRAGLKGQTNK